MMIINLKDKLNEEYIMTIKHKLIILHDYLPPVLYNYVGFDERQNYLKDNGLWNDSEFCELYRNQRMIKNQKLHEGVNAYQVALDEVIEFVEKYPEWSRILKD